MPTKKPEWEAHHPAAGKDVRQLEKRMQDGEGRDPTARRGELEEGGYVTDEDVGEDRILRKDAGQPPLMDASPEVRGKRVDDGEQSLGGAWGNPSGEGGQ